MNMGTSHFFNFIGEQNFHIYEQHYVHSKDFDNLRRSIRKMVMLLRNSDDVRIRDVHVNLRMLISKCLCFLKISQMADIHLAHRKSQNLPNSPGARSLRLDSV